MHTPDCTLFRINIDLWSETLLFSHLIVAGLVDRMIHLCCPNMYHALSYPEVLECIDLGSYRMPVCVDSLIVSSYYNMSIINCHALVWHHHPKLWLVCIDFYTRLP